MTDAGLRDGQWLVRRNGSFVLVTELLFRVAERCDGQRTIEDIARDLSKVTRWLVTPSDVHTLIEQKLAPMGLIRRPQPPNEATRTAPEQTETPRSALSVNFRRTLLGPAAVGRAADVLQGLFSPWVLGSAMALLVACHMWVYWGHGPTAGLAETIRRPELFLLVVGGLVLAGVIHELGHAAALRYGGGRPGRVGFGFYLVFPAFYSDVTDAYRLRRRDRIRTDLGGPYFHLLLTLPLVALHVLTGEEVLLLMVLLIDVEVLRQFIPFVRLDGYWFLADVTGIPDFFTQLRVFLTRVLRIRALREQPIPQLQLRRSARISFAVYMGVALIAIPALLLYTAVKLPGILSLAWQSLRIQAATAVDAATGGRIVATAAASVAILLLIIQILGMMAFVYLVGVRPIWRAWRSSIGQPPVVRWTVRGALGLAVGGMAAVLGALYPWDRIGPMVGGSIPGVKHTFGKVVLVAGLLLVAIAAVSILQSSSTRRWWLGLATVAIGLGVLWTDGLAINHSSSRMDDLINQSFRQTTGREASSAEVEEVREVATQLGIWVAAGYGGYITAAGGMVAAVGGAAVAVAARSVRTTARTVPRSSRKGVPTAR
jgi:putative peptide zinc metalloprotease protein